MMKIAEALKNHIHFKTNVVTIDNLIFRLHYRLTFGILMAGVAIVCAHEYIGERIRCLFPKSEFVPFIETYCFFTTTYTVVRHTNRSILNRHIPHPGVGPDLDDEETIRHSYYQWVPFFLFFQALGFYLPHLVWRLKENGRLKALVQGFDILAALNEREKNSNLTKIQLQFNDRVFIYRGWTSWMVLCEFLNLINLIFQVYLTDLFLSHQFLDLGSKVFWDIAGDDYNPLDVTFPKVTKCNFKQFGSSGTIQYHDIMCVMALNIINEKIFTVLWYWYIILFAMTVIGLVWRIISFLAHSSTKFSFFTLSFATQNKLDKNDLRTVMQAYTFSEWMFLSYLASNMDGIMFKELLSNLAQSIRTPHLYTSDLILPPLRDDSYTVKEELKAAKTV